MNTWLWELSGRTHLNHCQLEHFFLLYKSPLSNGVCLYKPGFGRLRQEDCELEGNLGYTLRTCFINRTKTSPLLFTKITERSLRSYIGEWQLDLINPSGKNEPGVFVIQAFAESLSRTGYTEAYTCAVLVVWEHSKGDDEVQSVQRVVKSQGRPRNWAIWTESHRRVCQVCHRRWRWESCAVNL